MIHFLVGAIIGGLCGLATAMAVTRLRMGIDEAISHIFLGATGGTVVGLLLGVRWPNILVYAGIGGMVGVPAAVRARWFSGRALRPWDDDSSGREDFLTARDDGEQPPAR